MFQSVKRNLEIAKKQIQDGIRDRFWIDHTTLIVQKSGERHPFNRLAVEIPLVTGFLYIPGG